MSPKKKSSKPPKNSPWKGYFTDGKLESVGGYKNGNKSGLWKFYYRNGKLKATGRLDAGKFTGLWKWWSENGQLRQQGKFKDGSRLACGNAGWPMDSFTMSAVTKMDRRSAFGKRMIRAAS
jgi:hypothetical protein